MTTGPCSDYHTVVFQCWRKNSARTETVFARSRLRLRPVMIILANRRNKAPVTLAADFSDATEASAVQWYEYCRDVCAIKMRGLHESCG